MNWFGLACAGAVLLWFAVPPFRAWLRQRAREREMRGNVAAFNQAFEKTNPPGPPLTPGEIADFQAYVAGLALPAVELVPGPGEVRAGGTRIGGPVWLAEGEDWPKARDGRPLEFVAQIDFAELPALPDFPRSGVLQFFIGNDDLFGIDFDDLTKGNFALLWREDTGGAGRLVPPPPLDAERDCTPWHDERVRAAGRALAGKAVIQQAGWGDWRIEARGDGWGNRPGFREMEDALYDAPGTAGQCHHVGGQPVYTQDDVRRDPRYQGHDRCLLRLTSDDAMMWGDVGEAVFLIPQAALRAKDWSKGLYSWDCS